MLSAARALDEPRFANCSCGRMAISDLWPLIFCAALTISPVIARSSDFERFFLPQPARNRRTKAAHAAEIRTPPRELKFRRPAAASRSPAWRLSSPPRRRPAIIPAPSSRRDHRAKSWEPRQAALDPLAREDRQSKDALLPWAAHPRRECPCWRE